ncbi:SDR family NAD(P)-dependent oxidoreductase [Sneathiella chinensis]|uniref:3-oxoacyl-ACP reductase n=1 Tax=Sneathiella chinensis TaxID=349750 RepID=A0ABQ5U7Z8_9PROT|nr:SDR family NAD(P)-dependent oxidoreductase [Sneathiella chinensis]GLQ06596.1 3-oxoacyl-ACP reductase [Sneathiella chinensis]
MTIRFDGKVAIVTGAGNGLGKCHAIALAARGAKVVVNDLGGARDGVGASSEAARAVVAEIEAAGGEAIANGADVTNYEQVEAMVNEAREKWGRVDILVNNAGVLRDKSFSNVELDDFGFVLDVHLMGAVNCTKAVWPLMREQNYGRVVMTTSSSGLYGNFGQTNYGAAKMGVIGLMNTLVLEGGKYGIRVNALSPCAATRMTEDLMPENLLGLLKPESVTPALLYLVSEDGPNRTIITAGAGTFARSIVYETGGMWLPEEDQTPEKIAEHWDAISDPSTQKEYTSGNDQTQNMLTKAAEGLGIKLQ